MKNLDEMYDDEFYSLQLEGSMRSAKEILGLIYEIYTPKSILDIGCGLGSWLSVASEYGAEILKGYDGDWVGTQKLLLDNIDFTAVDFGKKLPEIGIKYDLAISLEVAEHIDKKYADDFVRLLCESSDIVLFGAAVKFQGGTHHINEQWQSYWVEKFQQNGFKCHDIIRPQFWNNNNVEWWYKQNTFLFVKSGINHIDENMLKNYENAIFDVIHPDNYISKCHDAIYSINNNDLRCMRLFKSLYEKCVFLKDVPNKFFKFRLKKD